MAFGLLSETRVAFSFDSFPAGKGYDEDFV